MATRMGSNDTGNRNIEPAASATMENKQHVPPNFIEFYERKHSKFARWIDRLEGAFEIYGIEDEKKRRAYFLHYIGSECYDTLCDLMSPNLPKESEYGTLKKLLVKHLDPTPLEIAEYYKFHHRRQQEGESSREYVAVLRRLAATCNFGSFLDTALRNQFTCGMYDERIKEKLLETRELTLEKALEIAQSMETRKMEKMELEVNKINKEKTEREVRVAGESRRRVCYRCGSAEHYANKCPHMNAECRYCKKIGHLERSCLLKKKEKYTKNTNQIEEGDEQEYEVNFTQLTDKILVTAYINRIPVEMELDSGSAVSVMGYSEFKSKFPKVKLSGTNVKLKTYSNTLLNVLGVAEVVVQLTKDDENEQKLKLYVVSDVGKSKPGLFGRQWLRSFPKSIESIFSLNSVVSDSGKSDIKSCTKIKLAKLLHKYKLLFSDQKVGEIKGDPVALHLKRGSQPIFCRARPVPFALRAKVEKELDRLVEQGILEKVEYSEYATPIVPVLKPNGEVRLCGDFKVTINKQLVVDEHPLPTPDELFTGLAGGDKFSKIDLRCAYLQWRVRDEDQKLLTSRHNIIWFYSKA